MHRHVELHNQINQTTETQQTKLVTHVPVKHIGELHEKPVIEYQEKPSVHARTLNIGVNEDKVANTNRKLSTITEDYFITARKIATGECLSIINDIGEFVIASYIKQHIERYYKITPKRTSPGYFENGRKIDFGGLLSELQTELCSKRLNEIVRKNVSKRCRVSSYWLSGWLPWNWFSGVALHCE